MIAHSNCDIEALLLSEDGAGEDGLCVSEVELESLLAGEEEDVVINLSPSLPFSAIGSYSRSAPDHRVGHLNGQSCQNGLVIPTKGSVSDGRVDRTALSAKSPVVTEGDSEDEEDDAAAEAILAAVLSDYDGDEDFGDLTDKEVAADRYLSDLERAGRRERRYLLENSRQQGGPLNASLALPQSSSTPQGRFTYLALDGIAAAHNTSEVVTAAHFDLSCICTGTDNGLVTIFNHDQTVRNTLQLPDIVSPVAAIDTSGDHHYLVCGYENGMIALWNVLEGLPTNLPLMFIDDLHTIPMKFLKIIQRPISPHTKQIRSKSDSVISFLSSDTSGATHRVRVKKSMFTKYSYESECLLTGSAVSAKGRDGSSGKSSGVGAINCLSVLPPLPMDPSVLTRDWTDMEVMAFSTGTKTFIVQLKPKVMILHRWPLAPPESVAPPPPLSVTLASTSCDTEKEREKASEKGSESDGESEKSVSSSTNNSITSSTNRSINMNTPTKPTAPTPQAPNTSLDWVWTGTDGVQRSPLLLRSCGRSVQVLSLTLTLPVSILEGGLGTRGRDKGKGTITFNLNEHEVEDMDILSARWIDGDCSRIAAISETHLLILSYPAFTVLETTALVPEMTSVLRASSNSSGSDVRGGSGKSTQMSGPYTQTQTPNPTLGFESYGEDLYVFPVGATAARPLSLFPPQPIHFYRVTYSNKSHVRYESNIKYLVQQGKWLDALGLCLHCSSDASEDNRGNGIIRSEDEKKVLSKVELLFFEDLIKEYAGIAVCQHSIFIGRERRRGGTRILSSQSDSHYQLAAQVCIQCCIALDIADTLFSDVYEMFRISSQEDIFLRALASHVVVSQQSDPSAALRSLPLNVISNMERMADSPTSHLAPLSSFSLPLLERCILSLEMVTQARTYGTGGIPEIMLKHDLISGYLVASIGGRTDCVGAFRSAFEHFLSAHCHTQGSSPIPPDDDGDNDDDSTGQLDSIDRRVIGYKLLLFLSHTLSFLRFPTGQPSDASLPVLSLLALLEEVITAPPPATTTSDSWTDGSPMKLRAECDTSDPHRYLSVLATIDREALLHSLSVGLRNIAGEEHREAVRLLYVQLFEFARCSDSLVAEHCPLQGKRSMTDAFFYYCEVDLLRGTFVLPTGLVVAFIEYAAVRAPAGRSDAEGCDAAPAIGGGAEESLCRLVIAEISFSASSGDGSEESAAGRFEVLYPCLLRLQCHRAALLYEAGCCHARGGVYPFNGDLFDTALGHYTGTTETGPIGTPSPDLEVFRYLLTLANIMAGERIIFADTDTTEAIFDRAVLMASSSAPSCRDPSPALTELRRGLSPYLAALTLISMRETQTLVAALFACDIPSLIIATDSSPPIQFQLLRTMIHQILEAAASTEIPSTPVISAPIFLKYFTLLLAQDPHSAHPFLSRCKESGLHFPSKECLLLCTNALNGTRTDSSHSTRADRGSTWCLLDAVSSLKETSSDLQGALSAILLFISLAFKEEREGRDGRDGRGEGGSVSHGVRLLVRLCVSESSREGRPPHPGSEAHWYSALDSLLGILGKHKRSRGSHGSSGYHPALDPFVAAMPLYLTARGMAGYVQRTVRGDVPPSPSTAGGEEGSLSPAPPRQEDPLRVPCFRQMVTDMVGARGGVYRRGLLSSIAVCRGDLEALSKASLAERKKGRRYSRLSYDQSNKENLEKEVKEKDRSKGGEEEEEGPYLKAGAKHIEELRRKFLDLQGRFLTFPSRFSSLVPAGTIDPLIPAAGDIEGEGEDEEGDTVHL